MSEPCFLTRDEVLEIHAAQIDSRGGTHGVLDSGKLDSALGQPQSGFGGQFLHESIFEMAAAYLFHIARNHAFMDGNKRTALMCAGVFLLRNGYELTASREQLKSITMRTAKGEVDKTEIARFFEENTKPV